MAECFNMSELNTLAFNIGIDFEEISGVTKTERIVEFIKYCKRRGKIDELILTINSERNDILQGYVYSEDN